MKKGDFTAVAAICNPSTGDMKTLADAATVMQKMQADDERWLRKIIVETAETAIKSDALSEEVRKLISEELDQFTLCFDTFVRGAHGKTAALGAIMGVAMIFASAPPDEAVLKKLRQKASNPARAEKTTRAKSRRQKIADGFRLVSERDEDPLAISDTCAKRFRKRVAAVSGVRLGCDRTLRSILKEMDEGKL